MTCKRLVRAFEKFGDDFVEEVDLLGIDVDIIRSIFGDQQDDPLFYYCYPIDSAAAAKLKPYLAADIDLTKYDYFLECDAMPEVDSN